MRIAALLSCALFAALSVFAAELPPVTATLEPDRLAAGEMTILRITVEGSIRLKGAPDLALKNFQVESGPSIESRFEWINGHSSNQTILMYRLRAIKPGPASVGPVRIVDSLDRTLESPVASTTIGASPERTAPERSAPDRNGLNAGTISSDPQLIARLDPPRPYVGQQAIWTLFLVTRGRATQGEIKSLPDFKGFWAEDLDRESGGSPQVWNVGGILWRAYPMIRKAVFANRAGTLPIGDARAIIAIRSELFDIFADSPFSDSRPVERESPPITAQCRALPENAAHLPVGSFALKVSVDRPDVPPGGSFTVTAALTGDGRLADVAAPDLPLAGARASEPETRLSLRRTGGKVTAARSWQWVVTPEKSGPLSIPAIRISTFNPGSGRIVDATSAPITIHASGMPASTPPSPAPAPAPTPRRFERSLPLPAVLVPAVVSAALLILAVGYRLGRGRSRLVSPAPESAFPERPEAGVERVLDALDTASRRRGSEAVAEVARLREELIRVAFSPQLSSRDEALGRLEEASRRLARRWRVRV